MCSSVVHIERVARAACAAGRGAAMMAAIVARSRVMYCVMSCSISCIENSIKTRGFDRYFEANMGAKVQLMARPTARAMKADARRAGAGIYGMSVWKHLWVITAALRMPFKNFEKFRTQEVENP